MKQKQSATQKKQTARIKKSSNIVTESGMQGNPIEKYELTLDKIIGQDNAMKEFRLFAETIKYQKVADLWKSKSPKGILLVGPPGTGKTVSVRALAQELGNDVKLAELKSKDISSKWIDAPIENLNNFFKVVEEIAKEKHVFVFIDEIDGMIPSRDLHLSDGTRKLITVFLEWLDGGFKSIDNITIIASTNHISSIDSAFLRPGRIDSIIEFNLLSSEHIIDCIKVHLNKHSLNDKQLSSINWDEVLASIGNKLLSGADCAEIIHRIIRDKFSEHVKLLEFHNTDAKAISLGGKNKTLVYPEPISTNDIIFQLKAFRTVSEVSTFQSSKSIGF